MNPPLALTPLIAHIPHAVPVVIVWGIMLRFYFAQRKLKTGRPVRAEGAVVRQAADRPAARRVWAADDTPASGGEGSRGQELPVGGRTPVTPVTRH